MRNLKKVLSLSLALVMLIGMMVVGAGAAKFDDVPDGADKQEAIEVMNAIDIIKGDGTGDFRPNDTLTRAEAAVIISKVLLTPALMEKMAADNANMTTKFDDVANYQGGWAIPYVEACVASQVILGDDETHFAPDREVSGVEFAAMLLRVLDIDKGQFTNWPFDWQKAALQAGLDDKGVNVYAAKLSREDAAQMAFTALNYGEEVTTTGTKYVVTSTSNTISTDLYAAATGGDDKVAANTTFATVAGAANGGTYDTYTAALAAGNDVTIGYSGSDGNHATAVKAVYGVNFTIAPMTVTETVKEGSIAQTMYNNLRSTTTTDKFGNPSVSWIQGNNPLPLVSTQSGAALEYTTAVTGGKLYTDLGLNAQSAGRLTVKTVVDGLETASNTTVKGYLASGNTNEIAGNGALTKVYRTGANAITITVVNTYVGTVTYVPEVKNADGQVTTKEGVNVTVNATANPGTLANSGKFDTAGFSVADNGKTVIYTAVKTASAATYDVASVELAPSVTAVITRKTGADGLTQTVVAGGQTYAYSAKYDTSGYPAVNGQEVVLYLDNYGNIINTSAPEAAALNYAVIIGLASTGGSGSGTLGSSGSQQAMLLLPDGTNTTVTINPVLNGEKNYDGTVKTVGYMTAVPEAGAGNGTAADNHPELTAVNPAEFDVVTYTVNNKGEYNVTLVTKTTTQPDGNAITTNVPTIASGVVANDKTVFLVKTGTVGTAYTAYVGIHNVPSFTSTNGANTASRIVSENGIAKLVFLNVATAAGSSSTSKDLVFITSVGKVTDSVLNEATGTAVTMYTYNAVIDGQITTITSSDGSIATGLYKSLTYSDGVVSAATAADALASGTGKLGVNAVNGTPGNGVIGFDGSGTPAENTTYAYNAETVVYAVNAAGVITVSSIAALADNTAIQAVYVADNVVTAIYYTQA